MGFSSRDDPFGFENSRLYQADGGEQYEQGEIQVPRGFHDLSGDRKYFGS
jgi:hypothetical protein